MQAHTNSKCVQINFTFSNGKPLILPPTRKRKKIVNKKSRCVNNITHRHGGEGQDPHEGAHNNPTIHYIDISTVIEKTQEYLEETGLNWKGYLKV